MRLLLKKGIVANSLFYVQNRCIELVNSFVSWIKQEDVVAQSTNSKKSGLIGKS